MHAYFLAFQDVKGSEAHALVPYYCSTTPWPPGPLLMTPSIEQLSSQ